MRETRESISKVVKKGLCTGCGTCSSVCGEHAIKMVVDSRIQRYVPIVDELLCTDCGVCSRVCPGEAIDLDFSGPGELYCADHGPADRLMANYYIAHSKDSVIRRGASSGGIVTQILLHSTSTGFVDGAIVTSMSGSAPLRPHTKIEKERTGIILSSGSKYCPVAANSCLADVINHDGEYAIVGLPCHLHGLARAQEEIRELRDRITLRIGLFCSGSPSFRATDFILKKMDVSESEILSLDYRGNGWPGGLTVKRKSGKSLFVKYPDYFGGIGDKFIPLRCQVCLDWYSSHSDISCGDAWLKEITSEDGLGTSVVISRTTIGDRLLHEMTDEDAISLSRISESDVLRSQAGFQRKRDNVTTAIAVSKAVGYDFPRSRQRLRDLRPCRFAKSYLAYFVGEAPKSHGHGSLIRCYASVAECVSRARNGLVRQSE
jgi:coenzyme F420 hydrogenase subunit beta